MARTAPLSHSHAGTVADQLAAMNLPASDPAAPPSPQGRVATIPAAAEGQRFASGTDVGGSGDTDPVANVGEDANGAIAVASVDPAIREADDADRQQLAASGFSGEGEEVQSFLPTDTHGGTGGESAASATPAALAFASAEHALAQIGKESRPVVLRSDVRRARIEQDLREVDRHIAELDDRESLIDRVYTAAKTSLAAHRSDLEAERALLIAGLGERHHVG